ncbi:MAG: hypothetical protein V7K18_11235 [Nostoc sp.]
MMKGKTLISQNSKLKAALLQRGKNISAVGLPDLKAWFLFRWIGY